MLNIQTVPAEKDTKKIEPAGEEIDLSFVPSEEEVGNALETSGKLKKRKVTPFIEAGALFGLLGILLSIIFSYAGGFLGMGKTKLNFSHYLVTVDLLLHGSRCFHPARAAKEKYIRSATSGNQVNLKVYENLL